MDLTKIFQTPNPIIGVVHLLSLPTSSRWGGNLNTVIARAEREATALASGGVDGIIVENFFDAPFTKDRVDPAVVSAMSLIVDRLKNLVTLPIGVNVLRNDAHSALAIASCLEAAFIRVNVLTGIMATDQGLIEGRAHELLRYRRELGTDVKIFADVLVKHAYPLGDQLLTPTIQETIDRGLADAIILSGPTTGTPPKPEDLQLARQCTQATPLFIGSGADWHNIGSLLENADGVIIASALKRHGQIDQPIDPTRVNRFVEAAQHSLKTRHFPEEKL